MIDVDRGDQRRATHGRQPHAARRARPARSPISAVYDTTLDDLWDACTNAERIPRWFLPVSGELRDGGRYQLEGNAGGTIERCDPPTRLRRDMGVRRRGELDRAAPRRPRPTAGRGSSSSTSRTSTTSGGRSSARARSASAGTWGCSGSRSTSRAGERARPRGGRGVDGVGRGPRVRRASQRRVGARRASPRGPTPRRRGPRPARTTAVLHGRARRLISAGCRPAPPRGSAAARTPRPPSPPEGERDVAEARHAEAAGQVVARAARRAGTLRVKPLSPSTYVVEESPAPRSGTRRAGR